MIQVDLPRIPHFGEDLHPSMPWQDHGEVLLQSELRLDKLSISREALDGTLGTA
jgi:hypothetical protein